MKRRRDCQISVRGETYRAIREAAHCRGLPVGPLVDGIVSLFLDKAEREKPSVMKVATNIGELIAKSSVGAGLQNLRENPEDELAKLDEELDRLPRSFGGNAPDTVVVDVPLERRESKPQPRTRRAELAPLTNEELRARQADAFARAKQRENEHRLAHPMTFEIVKPR